MTALNMIRLGLIGSGPIGAFHAQSSPHASMAWSSPRSRIRLRQCLRVAARRPTSRPGVVQQVGEQDGDHASSRHTGGGLSRGRSGRDLLDVYVDTWPCPRVHETGAGPLGVRRTMGRRDAQLLQLGRSHATHRPPATA